MKKLKKRSPDAGPVWGRLLPVALLLLLQIPFSVFAQQKTVKGHVANESGQPLQGASVIVKGTSKGASTDANGNTEGPAFPQNKGY